MRRVADKLLHQPTVRVKELANETGAVSYATALAELFALDPEAVDAVTRPEGDESPTRPAAIARTPKPIRVGTRRSVLATTQSGHVAEMIRTLLGREAELVEVTTEGDRSQADGTPLATVGGTGVFVTALRDALLRGDVDVAVHSLKDLPTYPEAGIALAAIPTTGRTRATPSWPATGSRSASSRPEVGSEPAPRAGRAAARPRPRFGDLGNPRER